MAGPLECNRWDDGVDDQPELDAKPVRSADDFVRLRRPVTGWWLSRGPKSRCNARARSPMKPSPASWTCTRKAAGYPASRLAGARPDDRKAGSAGRAEEASPATNRWGRGRRPSGRPAVGQGGEAGERTPAGLPSGPDAADLSTAAAQGSPLRSQAVAVQDGCFLPGTRAVTRGAELGLRTLSGGGFPQRCAGGGRGRDQRAAGHH